MKKLLIVIALLSLCITTNSWASFSGYDTNNSISLATSTNWSGATFVWNVNKGDAGTGDNGTWQYIYTFSNNLSYTVPANNRAASLGIEVEPGFNIADPNKNLLSWGAAPSMTGPTQTTLPLLNISGFEWTLVTKGNDISLTLVTNTKPMWGDIYVAGNSSNYAYAKISDSVLVPSSTVPIPSAVWLLGSGLIGMLAVRRRFNK